MRLFAHAIFLGSMRERMDEPDVLECGIQPGREQIGDSGWRLMLKLEVIGPRSTIGNRGPAAPISVDKSPPKSDIDPRSRHDAQSVRESWTANPKHSTLPYQLTVDVVPLSPRPTTSGSRPAWNLC